MDQDIVELINFFYLKFKLLKNTVISDKIYYNKIFKPSLAS
ncbi:hypothetical protein MetMK1DRAFT_00019040 [Metallosphaera yellowstonensis MK1]|jgi:hypothetical protein|uniref:Uncharacterized protein n=1 Tax=Metallosphaera yellowstonensis MK1 TaxID=671065 RepID=H2C5T1_9CREN|nr:hypothetical protein MetMK1DRAFT_00019040 [Metallosphaera yellowstonensis MK1]